MFYGRAEVHSGMAAEGECHLASSLEEVKLQPTLRGGQVSANNPGIAQLVYMEHSTCKMLSIK